MLPIPAANIVTPRSAMALHSWGSAHSPIPTTPSSSPPIEPTSASRDIPFSLQIATNSFVFSTFSSNGRWEPSNMILENPASIHFLAPSYEPWSRWSATGTVMFNSSNIPFTIPTTVLYPVMYLPAPSDTPKITGDLHSSAVNRIAFVHSRLLILNCPTA